LPTESVFISTMSIAAKVAKDPEGYRELQTHVPEKNNLIGENSYMVSGPLFYDIKKKHNALDAPGLEPNFKEDPNVPDFKLRKPKIQHFTFYLSFTKITFKFKGVNVFFLMIPVVLTFQDSMALFSVTGNPLHILT
ncbi:hypothetical protein VP01_5933g2, partial [Puccinia sorghi]